MRSTRAHKKRSSAKARPGAPRKKAVKKTKRPHLWIVRPEEAEAALVSDSPPPYDPNREAEP
jgi:hypothetical protein